MVYQKKSKKTDLERKKPLFLELGMVIALSVTLLAFNWRSYEKQDPVIITRAANDIDEELVQITRLEKPPPPPKPPQQTTVIEIVENDLEINDDIDIDVEVDQNTEIEEYIPIEEPEEEEDAQKIFKVAETWPSFPGGVAARIKYLQENLKYPAMARESGIQGCVYVTFVVEKDGSITGVRLLRGIGGGCDEEAIRVVKSMPKWIPGKQRGKPVRVQLNMPIVFKLAG